MVVENFPVKLRGAGLLFFFDVRNEVQVVELRKCKAALRRVARSNAGQNRIGKRLNLALAAVIVRNFRELLRNLTAHWLAVHDFFSVVSKLPHTPALSAAARVA